MGRGQGKWVPATAPFSGAKEKFFLDNIGVEEREGVDKNQQKLTEEREHAAKK